MDLKEIFDGMNQGPKDINDNFELIKQAIIDNQSKIGSNEFKIQTYPIVTQNGWIGRGPNAFTKLSNDKYNIIAASFEIKKPKGVDFSSGAPIAGDPIVSGNGFDWTRIPGTDWVNGTFLPVLFLNGKIYTEHLGDNVWSTAASKDVEINLQVQHVFVWKK